MMQFKLYSGYPLDKIPKKIILGNTEDGGEALLDSEQRQGSHIVIFGQTGCGKSRQLVNILQEILAKGMGRVIFIDPIGEIYNLMLSWYAFHAREHYMQGQTQFEWFRDKVLANVLFWDLSSKNHLIRHNPIKPMAGEDLRDVIARMIKFFDSFLSNQAGSEGMDSQLQRRTNLVSLLTIFIATETPLGQARYFIYDENFRKQLLAQAQQKSTLPDVQEAVAHFRFLAEEFKGGKWADKIVSMETALNTLFESPILRNFLLTPEKNVDFQDILEKKTLFIKSPANDLPTKRILFNYFYNMFFDLADKRDVSKADTVYLGSDESALVFNAAYADTITRIRNKKVLLISALQSKIQMLTPEGIHIAKIIESQSNLKMYFRNDYQESVQNAEEIFTFTGKVPKLIEITTTITRNGSESASSGVSESQSKGKSMAIGQNIQEGATHTSQKNYSVTESLGLTESIQKQWSEAEGLNSTQSWSCQDAFQYSESVSRGLTQLSGQGITFTLGEGKSLLRIETENGSVTIANSKGKTETTSEGMGSNEGTGETTSCSHTDGAGISRHFYGSNGGSTISLTQDIPLTGTQRGNLSAGETVNRSWNESRGNSEQINRSTNAFKSISDSISTSSSEARAKGLTWGFNSGTTEQESLGLSRQFSEAVNLAKQYARSVQQSLGHTKSFGKSNSCTSTVGDSLSRSRQQSLQQGESLALATAKSWGANLNQGLNDGIAEGIQKTYSISTGMSISISWKLVYYSMAEEAILRAQELRSLPRRHFYLSVGNADPVKVITGACFLLPTSYGDYDFLRILMHHYHTLSPDKTLQLLPKFPGKSVSEARIYPPLPDDFLHFLPKI